MSRRVSQLLVATAAALALLAEACSPTLPPTAVPVPADSTFETLRAQLQAYVDQTQPYRKEAALAQERTPGKQQPASSAATSVRARQNVLAEALKTKVRPAAAQGEVFKPPVADAIRKRMADVFASEQRALILDELAEQNTTPPSSDTPTINERLDAPKLPPRLMELLPPLPKQLEYDFAGRTLVLRDVDADVVVDYLADALPANPPAGVPTAPPANIQAGATSPLPMPQLRGATTFALIGDSGSGDVPQQQVAGAMVTYFETARRFPFVLMLGDNLYHDDYENEFLVPYKALLDRGVKFYATLGNHDRELQQHFKPFNMGDTDRYSFDRGNIRFVSLNSNHPNDLEQISWLDAAFQDAGDRWRIAFFHHPLYSSGNHAAESRDVIRPAFENALVRTGINVVFSGHDHLYERVRPQRGVYYFVSGGGGRNLYGFDKSDFDEVGISEHHFMIVQVAGDRLLFEAISHAQKLLDCGVIYRVAPAADKLPGEMTKWLADCEAARPRVVTTNAKAR